MVLHWLIITDQAEGRILVLDSSTLELRASFRLQANLELTCTPLLFGADHLFVPLSDGSVMLLPLEMLGKPERKNP
jgi:hypothetical protein